MEAKELIGIVVDPADKEGNDLVRFLNGHPRRKKQIEDEPYLIVDGKQLALQVPGIGPFVVDPIDSAQVKNEAFLLFKAVKAREKLRVLDCFGGWGSDGLKLAEIGCRVSICEIHPLIFTMLKYRNSYLQNPAELVQANALDFLESTKMKFEVIYLDPMFGPHPTTASPSRSMQILATLTKTTDFQGIFEKALESCTGKVVLKQRKRSTLRVSIEPNYVIKGRSIRYEIYRS